MFYEEFLICPILESFLAFFALFYVLGVELGLKTVIKQLHISASIIDIKLSIVYELNKLLLMLIWVQNIVLESNICDFCKDEMLLIMTLQLRSFGEIF